MAVNVLTLVFQGFVVAWLIRRFELAGALVAMPIVALASFAVRSPAHAAYCCLLASGRSFRRAGEFGIAKPSREVLFTIVDAETKYKAKNFIDTVMQRGSDLVGVWLHLVLQSPSASALRLRHPVRRRHGARPPRSPATARPRHLSAASGHFLTAPAVQCLR